MSEKTLEYYIDRYLRGNITQEEFNMLRQLLNDPAQAQLLENMMEADLTLWEATDLKMPVVIERVQQGIVQKIALEAGVIPIQKRTAVLKTPWFRYSAAAIMILSIGAIFFWGIGGRREPNHTVLKTDNQKIIAPGREGAVLTLADGTKMLLDSLPKGVIAKQQGAAIVMDAGQITYDQAVETPSETVYNTMETPNGRQFQLSLPDGTKVWLNAASSIRYPVSFSSKERKVFVTGEVFFDVERNPEMPFIVDVNNKATIEVLGTRFNVNAYDDEPELRTTLEQGAVKVSNPQGALLLQPGRQVRITKDGKLNLVEDPDMIVTMSWRTDIFEFNYCKLDAALRQLARWYDVEIVYERKIPDIEFTGGIEKKLNLDQALDIINKMGVKFKVEGRTLKVM